MSFKHLGGALTPNQGYVCLRCRFGKSLNARQAIRNVQTETKGVSNKLVEAWKSALRLLPIPSNIHKVTLGLNERGERTVPCRIRKSKSTSKSYKRNSRSDSHLHQASTDSALKDAKVENSLDLQQKFLETRRRIALDLQKRQGERTRLLDNPTTHLKVPSVKSESSSPKSGVAKREAREGKKRDPKLSKAGKKSKPRENVSQDDSLKTRAQLLAHPDATKITHSPDWDSKNRTPPCKDAGISIETTPNTSNSPIGVAIRKALLNKTNTHLRQNSSAGLGKRNGKPASSRTAEIISSDKFVSKPNEIGHIYGSLEDVIKSWAQKKINSHNTSVKEPLEEKEDISPMATVQYKPRAKICKVRTIERRKIRKSFVDLGIRRCASRRSSTIRKPKDSLGQKLAGRLPTHNVSTKEAFVDQSQDGLIPMATRKVEKSKLNMRRIASAKGRGVTQKENTSSDPAAKLIENCQPNSRIETLNADQLRIAPLETEQSPSVPRLSYGLDRVLFNPGVYQLQDPRSRVFNFDPYLQTIMPMAEFDFSSLKAYITSSKDQTLKKIAKQYGKKYMGSSSSMTSTLAHFHFLLSRFRQVKVDMLSKSFPNQFKQVTQTLKGPAAIFLRWSNGSYAIDADKQYDSGTILSLLGKSLEKFLTVDTKGYEQYRKSSRDKVPLADRTAPEAFHYSTMGDILMRSQLDAHDHRLPGTGMFDLKTRAVVSIRMDVENYEQGVGYQIKSLQGEWESYEREYFDMIRSAFLKYSLQVRMGRMDGIFVAFHNVQRIFGFQYISLPEMDFALHGQFDTALGDQEFKLSLDLLNKVLDAATKKYPETSLRIHFETRDTISTIMQIFVEPVTEDQIEELQSKSEVQTNAIERNLLGLPADEPRIEQAQVEQHTENAEVEARVEETMDPNEATHPAQGDGSSMTSKTSNENRLEQNLNQYFDGDSHSQDTLDSLGEKATIKGYASIDIKNDKPGAFADELQVQSSKDASNSTGGILALDPSEARFDVSADSTFLDSITNSMAAVPKADVTAWTLSIRNKVNDIHVERPQGLSATDKWEVEYSLTEVNDPQHSRALYELCQKRRQSLFEKDIDTVPPGPFFEFLRSLSRDGVHWRKQMDEADQEKPRIVLSSSATVTTDQKDER